MIIDLTLPQSTVGEGVSVIVDGRDITRFVTDVKVYASVGDPTRVELHLVPDRVLLRAKDPELVTFVRMLSASSDEPKE